MANPIDLSTASSLEQQVYIAALALQNAELVVPEEERPDNASVNFSPEEATVTLTVTLPTTTTIENGKAVIAANTYLFDLASSGN